MKFIIATLNAISKTGWLSFQYYVLRNSIYDIYLKDVVDIGSSVSQTTFWHSFL